MKSSFQISVARFPGGGSTRWETAYWFEGVYHKMLIDPLVSKVVRRHYNDTPIYMSRNAAVDDALSAQSDYLLMIDNDICPELHEVGAKPFWQTAWDFLLRRRLREDGESLMPATVGAPYCGPPPIENVYVFRWMNVETFDPNGAFQLGQFSREEAYERAGIEEVAALPTGLILYDLRLFEHLPVPWFDYEWTNSKKVKRASTEDVFQTRNASLLGFPQYCAWDCWAGHMKIKRVLKPHPIATEDVSGLMHEALLNQRHRDRKIQFRGDPVDGPRPWAKPRPSEEEGFGTESMKTEEDLLDARLAAFRKGVPIDPEGPACCPDQGAILEAIHQGRRVSCAISASSLPTAAQIRHDELNQLAPEATDGDGREAPEVFGFI